MSLNEKIDPLLQQALGAGYVTIYLEDDEYDVLINNYETEKIIGRGIAKTLEDALVKAYRMTSRNEGEPKDG